MGIAKASASFMPIEAVEPALPVGGRRLVEFTQELDQQTSVLASKIFDTQPPLFLSQQTIFQTTSHWLPWQVESPVQMKILLMFVIDTLLMLFFLY